MMERRREKLRDNGQATTTATVTAGEERDSVLDSQPPAPPSQAWLKSLRDRPGAQASQVPTAIADADPSTNLPESINGKSPKSSSSVRVLGARSIKEKHDLTQGHGSETPKAVKWGQPAPVLVSRIQVPQKQTSPVATPAYPTDTKDYIQGEERSRIMEKVFGIKYTTIHQEPTSVKSFKLAGLDGHDRLDEAYYSFRRMMKEQHDELRLPGSRKPYGRVVIEEDGPPRKRTPCILLRPFRDEKEVTGWHVILSKSTWREYYAPLTLLYEKQTSKLDYISAHPQARFVNAAPRDTLCGTLVVVGDEQQQRVVTIGGVLRVDDQLWATTAAHSIVEEGERSISSTVETLTEDMIDHKQYPEDVTEALVFIKPDGETGIQSTSPTAYTGTDGAAGPDFTKLQLLGEGEMTGDDWSLIAIKDPALALPNAAFTRTGDRGLIGLDSAVYLEEWAETHPGPCDADILAGVSGSVAVRMTPSEVEVPLPSGAWVTAWECLVKSGHNLQRGDSGSWIVHPDDGMVYGQAVATMGDCVFILPMTTLMEEIKEQRKSFGSEVEVSLPSSSILLSDLARYHRHVLIADEYEKAALRTARAGNSENAPLSSGTVPTPAQPMLVPDSAVPKHPWSDAATTSFPEKPGRGTSEEHLPSKSAHTGVWLESEVDRGSESYVRPLVNDHNLVAQYTHMDFNEREDWYHALHKDRSLIDAYLRGVAHTRRAIGRASEESSSHLKNVIISMKEWRESDEYITGMPMVRSWRMFYDQRVGPPISPLAGLESDPSEPFFEYDPLEDMIGTKITYSENDDWSEARIQEERETIPIKEMLENPAMWSKSGMSPDRATQITHVHIPATNIEWVQRIIQYVNGTCNSQLLCPSSRSWTPTDAWRMRTTVKTVGEERKAFSPVSTAICIPFLDWDRPYRYKKLAQQLKKDQEAETVKKLQWDNEDRLSRQRVRSSLPRPTPRQPPVPGAFSWEFEETTMSHPLRKVLSVWKSHGRGSTGLPVKRDHSGRLLAATPVGQVLLDAAALSLVMSVHQERALFQRYCHDNGAISYRQPFVRQYSRTDSSKVHDDILYQATAPRHYSSPHAKAVGLAASHDEIYPWRDVIEEARKEARMLMTGDLWLWVLNENTILTCLAPRVGEAASPDSRDLQRDVHQSVSGRLREGLGCTIDNILAVILEVCLGTMFRGFQKDSHNIDLTQVAESEIATLSHRVDLRKIDVSSKLSTSTTTTSTSRHALQSRKRKTLAKDESLSASLDTCIAQLEDILDLTRQQLSALDNLAELHRMLKLRNPSANGVMDLSHNNAFVQMQFGLEQRVQELGSLARRAQNAKSYLDDVMGSTKQLWLIETSTPARSSVVPIILATFLPLIFTTTLFSAVDVGKLFWIMFPIGFALLCATMIIFITPLWRTLYASASLAWTFFTTHTGLYRLWLDITLDSPPFEQTAAARTERWKANAMRTRRKTRRERWLSREGESDLESERLEALVMKNIRKRTGVRIPDPEEMRGASGADLEKGKGPAI